MLRRSSHLAAAALVACASLVGCSDRRTPETPATAVAATAPATVAPVSPTPGDPTPAGPPAAGTTLVSVTLPGRVNVIAGVGGFDVVDSVRVMNTTQDNSTITTYDASGSELARIPSGRFTGECGALDVAPAGKRFIITAHNETQPAEGVNPKLESLSLTAWDAATGGKVWNTEVLPPTDETVFACQAYDGLLDNFAATSDGKWGVLGGVSTSHGAPVAVNLATGDLQAKPDILGVLGNAVLTGKYPGKVSLVDPSTWSVTATLSTTDRGDGIKLTGTGRNGELVTAEPGVLRVFSVGSSPYSGTSTDGAYLVAFEGKTIGGYALPRGQAVWHYPVGGNNDILVATTAKTLIVQRSADGSSSRLHAVDLSTGKDRWTLPAATVCGLTESQLLVAVNGQLAVIDLTTGKQLSYGPATDLVPNDVCPRVLPGGIKVVNRNQSLSVVQVLAT